MKSFGLVVILIGSFSVNALTSTLKVSNLGEWQAKTIDRNSEVSNLTGDAEMLLSTKQKGDDIGVTATIQRLKSDLKTSPARSIKGWRAAVLKNIKPGHIVTRQKAFKKGRQWYYTVEYQTDIGTETMMHSAVLATFVQGQLIALTFENHRNTFEIYREAARRLFKEIEIEIQ